ncbi:hypothetical protein CPB86DRAFT_834935 [Serendipita vermifera]|nr:hypothetical protein CPB86DRAFT_834935 [Serendipita vermifera]
MSGYWTTSRNGREEEPQKRRGSDERLTHGNGRAIDDRHSQPYGSPHGTYQPHKSSSSDSSRKHQAKDFGHKPNREAAQNTHSGGFFSYLGLGNKSATTSSYHYDTSHIQAEIQELTGKIARREEKIKKLSEEREEDFKNFQRQTDSLQAKLEKKETELRTTREDLLAIRKFVVVHDTRDARSLIQSFKDVNTGIDDIAFNLSQFRSNLLPEALSNEKLEKLHRQLGADATLGHFMQLIHHKKASPQDFIFYLSRALLCSRLLSNIFDRFHPFVNQEGDALLREVHSRMLQSEPQEKLGQWRAITYMHSNPTEEVKGSLLQQRSKDFLALMAVVFDALIPGAANTEQELTDDCGSPLLRLFQRAISLHEEIRTKYLLCDYQIYSIDGQTIFDKGTMEVEGERPDPEKVIFTISLGMRSQKNILKEKALKQERACIVKAVIFGNNWAPAT